MKHLFLILLLVLGGCGKTFFSPAKNSVVKNNQWKPNPRCRVVSKVHGNYMDMTITRNCLKNGYTTVVIVVNDVSDRGKKAAEEATRTLILTLGFRPRLAPLVITKVNGKPIFIFLVVGES